MLKKFDWKRWVMAFGWLTGSMLLWMYCEDMEVSVVPVLLSFCCIALICCSYPALKGYTRDSWMHSAIVGGVVFAIMVYLLIYGWLEEVVLRDEGTRVESAIALFVPVLPALFFYRMAINFAHRLIYRGQAESLPLRPPCKLVRGIVAYMFFSLLIQGILEPPLKDFSLKNWGILMLSFWATILLVAWFYKLLTAAFEPEHFEPFGRKS